MLEKGYTGGSGTFRVQLNLAQNVGIPFTFIYGGISIMSELRTNRIIPRDGLVSGSLGGGIIQVKCTNIYLKFRELVNFLIYHWM